MIVKYDVVLNNILIKRILSVSDKISKSRLSIHIDSQTYVA